MTIAAEQAAPDTDHRRRIGDRLRRIRQQQGLSLADVQARSEGRWKAVVVGAYERGDRTVTVSRMRELAEFYGVPLAELLPSQAASVAGGTAVPRVMLNLVPLRGEPSNDESAPTTPDDEIIGAVARFARRIQQIRGDHNGRVLTIRGNDVTTIASAIGREPDELLGVLRNRGVVGLAA